MRSPLSQQPAEKIRDLPRTFLHARLAEYFHAPAPAEIVTEDYSLWRCIETGLEFCAPPVPGNPAFYEWVSGFDGYYQGERWEYGAVGAELKDHAGPGFKILDVGCGPGDFFKVLDFLPPGQKYALDLNEPAIRICRERGYPAFCGTMTTATAAGFVAPGGFSVVTSFHCLEHVADPVGFCRELLCAVAPGGKLYLSTPCSPMSFESDWFDVQNHPPHHMTRWNPAAYRQLAKILGVTMRPLAPPARPFRQALQKLCLQLHGPNVFVPREVLLKDLLRHGPRFLAHWWRLAARARRHELRGADLILVEFTVPAGPAAQT